MSFERYALKTLESINNIFNLKNRLKYYLYCFCQGSKIVFFDPVLWLKICMSKIHKKGV